MNLLLKFLQKNDNVFWVWIVAALLAGFTVNALSPIGQSEFEAGEEVSESALAGTTFTVVGEGIVIADLAEIEVISHEGNQTTYRVLQSGVIQVIQHDGVTIEHTNQMKALHFMLNFSIGMGLVMLPSLFILMLFSHKH